MSTYIPLTEAQIDKLKNNNCTAADWKDITVSQDFSTSSVCCASFAGKVAIGKLTGTVKDLHGIEKPAGIYNASIINCTIGDNSRIANISVHIANYNIAENVCIENAATIQTNQGAAFGNGVEVEVLNEAGGRNVVIFNELSAQIAYLMCLHRYKPEMIKKLTALANNYAASVKSDTGTIGTGAKISSAVEIVDVNIGPFAQINAPASLVNGTILSTEDAPAEVGTSVSAKDFIISESSQVTGGAILAKTFIGQGCQMGKQYSAENSLFFANSEAFHGEACSIFAGPYTVTHHKSTLLIAGLFSFYNAGSGSNQSNHMYKLGPCHEGKLQRGTKTGSFSYMMWPCRTGPFSVVLGKHSSTFDTADYPFSHHEATHSGKCAMIPGLHLTTVGTVRDGAKWPARDRRKGSVKRDIISFDVFSPYTVGKMIKATALLDEIYSNTDKSVEETSVGGAMVRRPILRTGKKYYRTGIEMFILEKVIEKAEQGLKDGSIEKAFEVSDSAVYSQQWVDIAGQMMPKQRLDQLHNDIENSAVTNIEDLYSKLNDINDSYAADEWAWTINAYKEVFGTELTSSKEQLFADADKLAKVKGKFLKLVTADAEKEFAQLSRTGFGQDGTKDDRDVDFEQIRGTYEENKFVKNMRQSIEQLDTQIDNFKQQLNKL